MLLLENLSGIKPMADSCWSDKGAVLPNGTQLVMRYHGKLHHGYIHNGRFCVDGEYADSPSGACRLIVYEHLNGWNYWFARRPQDKGWIRLMDLRRIDLQI